MYEAFFGLNCNPFQLSPDPFFLYSSERSNEALASISNAIHRHQGFVVMTGEVGTGKTLVLRCLVEWLDREQIPFAYFIGPKLSTADFLNYIAFELGLTVGEATKGTLLRALYGFLLAQYEKGLTTVLIIDEAHQMPRSVLEEIRLLTNFETAQQKLIQIVLAGQPELEQKLDSVELRSLKQRIAVRCRLEPLRKEEIRRYIERRLELAGVRTTTLFPAETLDEIYRYSQGIPRLVNSICDQALIAAHASRVRAVDAEIIREVASRFRLDPALNPKRFGEPPSLAGKDENSVLKEPRNTAPAAKASAMECPNPEALDTPKENNGTLVQVAAEAANTNTLREQFTPEQKVIVRSQQPAEQSTGVRLSDGDTAVPNPTRRGISRFDQVPEDTGPFNIRRWFRTGFRFSLIVGIIVVVPAALATRVFMARHDKAAVTVPHEDLGARRNLLAEQTVVSTQPAVARYSAPINVDSADRAMPQTDTSILNSAETGKHWMAAKPSIRPSRPIPKSFLRSAASDPPSIPSETGDPYPSIAPVEESLLPEITSSLKSALPPPVSPANNRAPVAVGGKIRDPRLLSSVLPLYPSLARETHTEGSVAVEITIDKAGNVSDAKAMSGPLVLRQAAVDAVRRWKYEPSLLDGWPTPVHMSITIRFQL